MPKKSDNLTKSQLMSELAAGTGLMKKDVEKVFEVLEQIIRRELKKPDGELAVLPGLVKVKKATKKATKARVGRNPATGEEIQIAAKPASKVIRLRALKTLKEMV